MKVNAFSTAEIADGGVTRITLSDGGAGYSAENPPTVMLQGGADFDPTLKPTDVHPKWYVIGIIAFAGSNVACGRCLRCLAIPARLCKPIGMEPGFGGVQASAYFSTPRHVWRCAASLTKVHVLTRRSMKFENLTATVWSFQCCIGVATGSTTNRTG